MGVEFLGFFCILFMKIKESLFDIEGNIRDFISS